MPRIFTRCQQLFLSVRKFLQISKGGLVSGEELTVDQGCNELVLLFIGLLTLQSSAGGPEPLRS